jgi:hypothetical protein
MSRVVTVLGSILAFGWGGLHVASLYIKTHRHSLDWESYLAGGIGGCLLGAGLSILLIKVFVGIDSGQARDGGAK